MTAFEGSGFKGADPLNPRRFGSLNQVTFEERELSIHGI